MRQDAKRVPLSSPRTNSLAAPPISPGKIILACVLIVVMAILWIRIVFRHRSPAKASAQKNVTQVSAPPSNTLSPLPPTQLTYSRLPIREGRHDTLARNIFANPNAVVFPWQTPTPVDPVEPVAPGDDPVRKQWNTIVCPLLKKISVDAIVNDAKGTGYQAFLQDKCLSVGAILPIRQGANRYEITVKEIRSNAVVLEWESYSETIKMSEPDNSGEN